MSRGKGKGLKGDSGREREWGRESCNVSNIYRFAGSSVCPEWEAYQKEHKAVLTR